MSLILASSSPFRAALLTKLGIEFEIISPDIDETKKPHESAQQLVHRLAQEKAHKVATIQQKKDALIIASDQVATLNGQILGKPANHQQAVIQLTQSSANTVVFFSSLALLNTNTDKIQTITEPFKVVFKTLTSSQIEFYLQTEKPYNCAGSFKSEGLGIALLESLEGNDPNTLIGLPLIALIKMLKNEGIDILASP